MQDYRTGKNVIYVSQGGYNECGYYNYDKLVINLDSWYNLNTKKYCLFLSDFNEKTTINKITTLPENAKVYFDKSSKFPRHKLQLTSFKRKIKTKDADCIIGNIECPIFGGPQLIIVGENCIYYGHHLTLEDFKKYFPEINIVETREDTFVQLTPENILYYQLVSGEITIPFMNDIDFNKIVDSKCEKISPEEVESVIDLIVSGDSENIKLGIKLFSQFNLSAYPTFTKVFLSYYRDKISRGVGSKPVVYTNLLKQYPPFYLNVSNLYSYIKDGNVQDEEKALLRMVIKTRQFYDKLSRDAIYNLIDLPIPDEENNSY